jgi:potassium/hydrogen antiporter
LDSIKSVMKEIIIPAQSEIVGKKIVHLDFPKTAQILSIKRGKNYISPVGSTVLLPNDTLLILAEDEKAFFLAIQSLKIHL